MDKIWILFVLLAATSTSIYADNALRKDGEDAGQDLDKVYDDAWYQEELEQLGIINENGEDTDTDNSDESESEELNEGDSIETGDYYDEFHEAANLQSIEKETSQNLEHEVQKISSEEAVNKLEDQNDAGEEFDANIDYQIEDNRSELKDEMLNKVLYTKIDKETDNAASQNDEKIDADFEDINDLIEENANEVEGKVDSIEMHQVESDNNGPNQAEFEEDAALVDETNDILSNDTDDNDFNDLEAEASQQVEFRSDLAEETKNILQETDTFMDDGPSLTNDSNNKAEQEKSTEGNDNSAESIKNEDEVAEDDEEIEKIYTDLQSDLDKLVDTWKKLQESDEDIKEKEDNPIAHEDIIDYEEKYGRPFREGIVLQQRDYENMYDDNLSEVFEESKNASPENNNEKVISTGDMNDDDYEQVNDNNLSQIFKESEEQMLKNNPPSLTDDIAQKDSEQKDESDVELDAAEAKKQPDEEILHENSVINPNNVPENSNGSQSSAKKKEINVHNVKEMDIRELNANDLERFMTQFDVVHNSNLLATDCDENEGPIRKTLNVDEPLIISSCGFPDRYPTNKVMDWILDGAGQGMGIELNVTDLDLNGALGDYLMIKPGQADTSGQDGLVFSFHLNSQRNYRFLDVDRIFIRFEAHLGLAFRTGFRLSVKLVEPPREIQPEVAPEPEALIPSPAETFTVNLGGVTLQEFLSIEEEFRRLVADMALMYINANNINNGRNSTFETTQIVSRAICNIHWPNFENCVEVKFGVPLVREDELDDEEVRLNEDDLAAMWNTYVGQDPFSARLRRMGVVEFTVPNDSSVLTVWMVVAVGVLISVAMLAFALWRFSCFEDYTRMAAYSDSDSFSNEKRGLDLYPTPHQTLPPLYSDADYKWADNGDRSTRVDMGGFANKSYVQDDLFNLDSDEEVIASRERSDKSLYTTDV